MAKKNNSVMSFEEDKSEDKAGELSLTNEQEQKLLDQIKKEYKLAKLSLDARVKVNLKRLRLYNNQKKYKKKVGVPLLFTIFNSLLASLYDDRMSTVWEGREPGDDDVEEYLNLVAEYDYDKMEKAELDYEVLFDALFYGFGLMNMTEFDRKKTIPMPEVIDPSSFLYDPEAASIDGNSQGRGAMRFCGREVLLTKYQMKKIPNFKRIDKVAHTARVEDDLVNQAVRERQDASGLSQSLQGQREDLGENTSFKVLEWRTWFDDKQVLVHVSSDMSVLNRYDTIEQDGWGLVSKIVWRVSHQFAGVSVPDLVEDKQRKQSEMVNLAIGSTKSDLYPMYAYDEKRVTNRNDLSFGFNKFIPVTGDPSTIISPLRKASPNLALYSTVMEFLDASSQRATATPELQQGVISKEARTLGELNLVAQKVDTRYSLVVKSLMMGEKKFWRLWYLLYKQNLKKNIDKKVIRLRGATSTKFRILTRENLITSKIDPDARVESKILNEARDMNSLSKQGQIVALAGEDPTSNRRWGLKHLARLAGFIDQEIDLLLPPTLDELLAREQNEALNNNERVPVEPDDNHYVHLEVHSEANPTDETRIHAEGHKMALVLQRSNPELFPNLEQGTIEGGEGLQPGQAGQMPEEGGDESQFPTEAPVSPSKEAEKEVAINASI